MRVTIRPADLDKDALAIVDGARDFAEMTNWTSLFPKDYNKFVAAIGRVMTLEGFEIILAEHENKVVGGIGILYAPFLWNPDLLVGDEIFWWADKEAPYRTGTSLFIEALNQIDEKGAIPLFTLLETSPKGAEKLYNKNGLFRLETKYTRL